MASLAMNGMNATTASLARRRLQAHDVTAASQVVAKDHRSHRQPLPGVPSYLTSSVHFEWCMDYERFQVDSFVADLTNKRGHCVVLDVGMNDGFYTMLSAALGCRVYAFEVQEMCVEIAHDFLKRNAFEDRVTIFNQPVSAQNNAVLAIPRLNACDGGFSFSGAFANAKSGTLVGHLGMQVRDKKEFHAIALDTFVPPGTTVDILKIDTEGHERQVLKGAKRLYETRAIRKTWLEVKEPGGERAWQSFKVLHDIMNSGYTAQFAGTASCPKGVFQASDWNAFHRHLQDPKRACVDVLLSLAHAHEGVGTRRGGVEAPRRADPYASAPSSNTTEQRSMASSESSSGAKGKKKGWFR